MINGIMFSNDYSAYVNGSTYVGVIRSGINSKKDLILEYREKFKFPHGNLNWDSLEDLLSDFQWIDATRIVIVHEDLPSLDKETLRIYCDILSKISFFDQGRDLKKFSDKNKIRAFDGVLVFFPAKYKDSVVALLREQAK